MNTIFKKLSLALTLLVAELDTQIPSFNIPVFPNSILKVVMLVFLNLEYVEKQMRIVNRYVRWSGRWATDLKLSNRQTLDARQGKREGEADHVVIMILAWAVIPVS